MSRLTSLLLALLLCFYTSGSPALAAVAADYESLVNQLTYATTGQLPSPATLTNLCSALAATNAPTDLAGLAAAYSTNAAVKTLVDSMGSTPGAPTGCTVSFVNSIYQNAFGHAAQFDGLLYWASAIDSGAITKGNAALAILAGGSVDDITTLSSKVTIAQSFVAPIDTTTTTITGYSGATAAESARNLLAQQTAEAAAKEAAEKAAQEAADKAAKEAAEKAAKEAAEKAAKEAADKAAKEAEKAAKQSTSSGEGLVDKVKTFVHDHPVATAIIATVVVAGIVTAITVPICVHQNNVNKANNQQKTLNNQAIVTRLIQLANPTPTVTTTITTSGSSGGYQPPI